METLHPIGYYPTSLAQIWKSGIKIKHLEDRLRGATDPQGNIIIIEFSRDYKCFFYSICLDSVTKCVYGGDITTSLIGFIPGTTPYNQAVKS
jgi:hypothetical protein